jgi:triacylglycerol lipase
MTRRIWSTLTLCLALLTALPAPSWAAGYTQTKYPIVLVHGLFGFDSVGRSITSTASPRRCAAAAPMCT